jgi:hypothetical protein
MNNSQVTSSKPSNADDSAYIAALNCANARSFHSYFNQYILTDFERGYIVIDEGDYGALPPQLMDRVIDSVPGRMSDEY